MAQDPLKVTISEGNSKLGKVANISLPPGVGCRPDAPCRKLCYARRAWIYKEVRAAWQGNADAYLDNPSAYFGMIVHLLSRHPNVKLFRWHISGDIPTADYWHGMCQVAAAFQGIRFLCFTKRYDLPIDFRDCPRNLRVVLSAWPGLPLVNPRLLPVAYMDDGTDPRIPKTAKSCPGGCDTCAACWSLRPGQSVRFAKH